MLRHPGNAAILGLANTWTANQTMSAHLLFSADNTFDIGASGATRPRTLYLGTGVNIAGVAQPVAGITTIASGSLPAAATQDITSIPATYAYLILQVTGWSQATNTARLLVRVDTDNGVSFDATAGNYVGINISGTTTTNWTTNAGASLTDGATQTVAQTGSATVYIYGYHAAPMALAISRVIAATTETQCWGNFIGAGGAAINAIRIATSAAGNFDAGTYALYGVQ